MRYVTEFCLFVLLSGHNTDQLRPALSVCLSA